MGKTRLYIYVPKKSTDSGVVRPKKLTTTKMYPNRYVLRHYCMTYGHLTVQSMYDVLRGSGNDYSGVELYDYYRVNLRPTFR